MHWESVAAVAVVVVANAFAVDVEGEVQEGGGGLGKVRERRDGEKEMRHLQWSFPQCHPLRDQCCSFCLPCWSCW